MWLMSETTTVRSHDRRRRADRRQHTVRVAVDRRRHNDRREAGQELTAEERAKREELEFTRAMEQLRRLVRYPTCRQVLQAAHGLGYQRTLPRPARGGGPAAP